MSVRMPGRRPRPYPLHHCLPATAACMVPDDTGVLRQSTAGLMRSTSMRSLYCAHSPGPQPRSMQVNRGKPHEEVTSSPVVHTPFTRQTLVQTTKLPLGMQGGKLLQFVSPVRSRAGRARLQRKAEQRVDEVVGEQVRLQAQLHQARVLGVVVVLLRLHARVGHALHLHSQACHM